MDCPRGCHGGSKVLRTSSTRYEVRRHRQCLKCRVRFFTLEGLEVEEAGSRGKPLVQTEQQRKQERRPPAYTKDELSMVKALEKGGEENWDLDRLEKTLMIDLHHFNKAD